MTSKFLERNAQILEAKGTIPYWAIADQLDVHENTLRNWMKRDMIPLKKEMILKAIEDIKRQEGIKWC